MTDFRPGRSQVIPPVIKNLIIINVIVFLLQWSVQRTGSSFMENYFAMGDEIFVFGKLKETKPRTMDHPETEVIEGGEESFIHINRIAPVYPLTEGLPQRWLRGLIWRTLEKFVAAPRQSAVNCEMKCGFLPKAATRVLQRSPLGLENQTATTHQEMRARIQLF